MGGLTQTQFTSPRYEDLFLLWSSFSSVFGASHSRMFVRCMVRCLCCLLLPILLLLYSILSRLPLPWTLRPFRKRTLTPRFADSYFSRAAVAHTNKYVPHYVKSKYIVVDGRHSIGTERIPANPIGRIGHGAYICSGKGPRPPHVNA